MDLISFDQFDINVTFTHAEFELLRGYVEHAAEWDRDMPFNHPQLLAGFRDIPAKIRFATEEGLLSDS
jgi:hypothetical protein